MNANLVFLMLVAVHVALCRYADESGSLEKKSIVNGFDARKDYKFYVLVRGCDRANPDAYCPRCGGSLITNTTVLTAAHCIDELQDAGHQDPYLKVEAGDFTDIYSPKDEIEVRDTMVHPGYNSINKRDAGHSDIALVYLARRPRNRSPIRLCTSKYAQDTINVIGMGLLVSTTPVDMKIVPDVLQQVRLREYNITNCPAPDIEDFDENKQICLAGRDVLNKDSCAGDSGGPAFPEISNTCVYGIVSYGSPECAWDGNGYGIYIRVPAYKKWIKQNA